jgi:hypothetical protein
MIKVCANQACGKEFTPNVFRPGQKYCCRKCENHVNRNTWYGVNKERSATVHHMWHASNKNKASDYGKMWRQLNPDKRQDMHRRRRATKFGAAGDHYTASQFQDLCSQFDNICLKCGQSKNLTADHVVPLSKGGSDSIDNIQPLCGICNSEKGTKTIDYRGVH